MPTKASSVAILHWIIETVKRGKSTRTMHMQAYDTLSEAKRDERLMQLQAKACKGSPVRVTNIGVIEDLPIHGRASLTRSITL